MNKIVSLIASVCLILTFVPATAFAAPLTDGSSQGAIPANEAEVPEKERAAIAEEMKAASYGELAALPSFDPVSYSSDKLLITVDLEALGLEELSAEDISNILLDEGSLLQGCMFRAMAEDVRISGDAQFAVLLPEGLSVGEALEAFLALDSVLSASPNYLYFPDETTPDDPGLDYVWGLYVVNAFNAWDYATCDGEVAVAILDMAFDLTHEDLVDNIDVTRAYDAVDQMPLAACPNHCGTTYGHGTAVSGVVAAVSDNGIGISGYSHNAKIVPVAAASIDSNGNESFGNEEVYEALYYIKRLYDVGNGSDIKVINMSFGWDNQYETRVKAMIDTLRTDHGVTFVASAGNSGSQAHNYPADYSSVIGVTAVNVARSYVNGWTYSGDASVCAPGASIWTTTPIDDYALYWGTSFSAPVVSSTAAVMYAANTYMEPDGCQAILEATAQDLGDEGYDAYYGYGLVDMGEAVRYANYSEFSDVDLTGWPVTEGWIPYVVENGILAGYDDGTAFAPGDAMTRAMLLTALWRLATPGWESLPTQANNTGFTDIPDNKFYTAAYNWAWANNVISHSSSTGKPGSAVTRQETVQFVRLAAGAMGADTSVSGMSQPPYSDWTSIVSWARDSAKWCYHKGVMTGYGAQFRPTATLTRAQCAKVLSVLHRDVL